MIDKTIEINHGCKIVFTTWLNKTHEPSATIEYIEHRELSIDVESEAEITRDKAVEIISLLKETFGL